MLFEVGVGFWERVWRFKS